MITTLTGEPARVKEQLAAIRQSFLKNATEHDIELLDDLEIDAATYVGAVSTLPLFSEHKLVIIKDITHSKSGVKIDSLVSNADPRVKVVFVESQPDKRSTAYKVLKEKTDLKDLAAKRGNELILYGMERAQQLGLTATRPQVQYLVSVVGENELLLSNELVKLAAAGSCSKETVDTLVDKTPRSKIFDLLKAALNKNIARSLEIYDEQRMQKVEPQAIFGLIVWQLQVLALAKTSSNIEQTAQAAKMSTYPLESANRVVGRVAYSDLQRMIDEASEIDIALKEGANPDQAIKAYISSFSS